MASRSKSRSQSPPSSSQWELVPTAAASAPQPGAIADLTRSTIGLVVTLAMIAGGLVVIVGAFGHSATVGAVTSGVVASLAYLFAIKRYGLALALMAAVVVAAALLAATPAA